MPGWNYLYSDIFKIRYLIAAHYLRECPHVIEIGGYKTPIDQFLQHDYESVVVLDPLVEPKESGRIRHIACDYRDFDTTSLDGSAYGLAILGFDLPLSDQLYRLANGARRTVVEFPEDPTWTQSRDGFNAFLAHTRLRQIAQMRLDLSGNEYGDLTDSWPPRVYRNIYVLEPA